MKNVAITSSLLMLLGSAIAQPAISRRLHHQHHRRDSAKYVTVTITETYTKYKISTCWVSDDYVAAATPTPNAGPVLVQAPPKKEDKKQEKKEPAYVPPPPPPPPADDKYEERPKEQPKERPKQEPKEETKAYVPNDIISEQDRKNKEQEKINEEMERKNREHQEQMDNLQNGGGSSYPVKQGPPKEKPAPPPVQSPPQTGGGGANLKISGKGHATFYEPGPGACGWMNTDDEMVCAISKEIFDKTTPNGNPNNNPLCGTFIEASYGGVSVRLKVVDRCGGCQTDQDVDMSSTAFKKLADLGVGRLTDLKWKSCD